MKNTLKGSFILTLTAIIWGTTFIMQKKASGIVDAFTFNFFRSIIAFILLTIIAFFTRNKISTDENDEEGKVVTKKKLYIYAMLAGIGMAGGATFQQIGIKTCEASTAAFLTSLYIIFVPILGIVFGKKAKLKIWICVVVAIIGAYVLAKTGENFFTFDLSLGSILIVISGMFWALQINAVGKIANNINPFKLCAIELLVTTIVSFFGMIIAETIVLDNVFKVMPYILYAAVLSGTLSFAFQNIGQKYCESNLATLIMSLEAIFALISGVIFLKETLELNEIIGSIMIFSSVIVAQISFKNNIKEEKI